jgi:hypothetical protein
MPIVDSLKMLLLRAVQMMQWEVNEEWLSVRSPRLDGAGYFMMKRLEWRHSLEKGNKHAADVGTTPM